MLHVLLPLRVLLLCICHNFVSENNMKNSGHDKVVMNKSPTVLEAPELLKISAKTLP